jgi:hypothetical protein
MFSPHCVRDHSSWIELTTLIPKNIFFPSTGPIIVDTSATLFQPEKPVFYVSVDENGIYEAQA